MRKIIVYIATSADGYIARPDGNVDWLNRPRAAGDYGMGCLYRVIDKMLWCRESDEAARHLDVPLQLRSCRRYSDGVVRLHYSVVKPRSRKGRAGKARPNKRLKLTGAAK